MAKTFKEYILILDICIYGVLQIALSVFFALMASTSYNNFSHKGVKVNQGLKIAQRLSLQSVKILPYPTSQTICNLVLLQIFLKELKLYTFVHCPMLNRYKLVSTPLK